MKLKNLIQSLGKIRFSKTQLYILSFLVPLASMLACMIGFEVQPFGNNSFMIVDALHQYMPFFTVLYDKLKAGEGLFYTFRTGLGINFLSLFSYYLSSPLNLFILFFKKTQLNMALSLLISLKIALSGLMAAIYFEQKTEKAGVLLWLVSMTYALNSYMVGYSWNIMWLDAIMIFPIVLLGIERLIEKKDGRLYAAALFYALYCNYYIAFMICIFAVLWYLLYHFTSVKQFILRGFSFAGYSLLAAGMAAVLLLPAYMGIKETASGEDMSLPGHSFLTSFTDLINRQFALTTPISHDNFDGNANLYFGVFTLLTFVLFLLNRQIKMGKKIRLTALYLFMMLSCNEEILNFIWHGFHNQYGIPNRFSFMMGFVLLCMMFETLTHLEGIEIWHPVLGGGILGGLILVSRSSAGEVLPTECYIACGVLLLIYVLLMLGCQQLPKYRPLLLVLFYFIAMGEMCVSSILGYDLIGQIHVDKFFTGIEDMDTATKDLDNGDFFRSELAEAKIVDESTMYPMRAVSLFGSTAKHDMTCIMDALGFYTGCNEYLYKGDCPITNQLFAMKYHYYHTLDSKKSDFTYKASYGEFDVYENPSAPLSVGYLMNQQVQEWNHKSAYPFRVLNSLCETAWNIEGMFESISLQEPEANGVLLRKTNDGEYHFDLEEVQEENIIFCVKMDRDVEDLYIHYDGTQVEDARVEVAGEFILSGDEDSRILSLGSAQKGDLVKISMKLKGEQDSGVVRISMASMNRSKFVQWQALLEQGKFCVTEHTDSHLEGTVTADGAQDLFFSIPYDKGWTVKIDGKSAETHKIGNAFLSVIIPTGEHKVTLDYISPGFSQGWKISVGCLFLYIVLHIYHRRKKSAVESLSKEEHDDEDE